MKSFATARRLTRLTFVFLATTLLPLHIDAAFAAQGKCVVGKTKCAAKEAAALLKCEQKAETPGKPTDPNAGGCVDKAQAIFDGGSVPADGCFEKLEAKIPNDCVAIDNTVGAGNVVEACIASLVAAIDPPPLDQNKCGVGKKKCVGKLLKALLKCEAKAQTPGKPTDPNAADCITKAKAKFNGLFPADGCFQKLEAKDGNDCLSPLANSAALEALAEACANNLVAATETPPVCVPGATSSCYTGSPGTAGVGLCVSGLQTCESDGLGFGACIGEVLPSAEVCGDAIDEDCDGSTAGADLDGDGWTTCQNDCCDTASGACTSPALVNPGAIEVVGNGVDDDCDVATSDVTPASTCSAAAKFSSVTATNLANGMDLCQTTTANPPLMARTWGLISASMLRVSGGALTVGELAFAQNSQSAVLVDYGSVVVPQEGTTMVGLSTGIMRDAGDPGFVNPIDGTSFGNSRDESFNSAVGPLGTFVSAHGSALAPAQCGAVACPLGTTAHDGVLLRLAVRVPTNAQSFSYDMRFFSADYQTFQCTSFNDYFLTLLTTGAVGIPADHNIALDSYLRPVNVNSPDLAVCSGNGKNCNACPSGTADLAGTGMAAPVNGGGTEWLTMSAPVVPGEIITLDFLIFDVGDGSYDSLALLDKFRWTTTDQ
jgi:hypothetical protein